MRNLHRLLLAVVAGSAVTLASVAAAGALGVRPSFVGESHPTSVESLRPNGVLSPTGFVPVTPCRILDTRNASAGPLTTAGGRFVQVIGTSGFPVQGGAAKGCAIPTEASAITASITAVDPSGGGYLRAWPHDTTPPTATVLNWLAASTGGVTTGVTVPVFSGGIDVRAFGSGTDLVIDVSGYYVEPITAQITTAGDMVGWSSGVLFAARSTTGNYAIQTARPVLGCAVTASPFSVTTKATALAATGNVINVILTDIDTGEQVNGNFTVSAVC